MAVKNPFGKDKENKLSFNMRDDEEELNQESKSDKDTPGESPEERARRGADEITQRLLDNQPKKK